MPILEIARIQIRRGQELQTVVPQLEPGEFGWAQDTQNLYIGKRINEGAVNNDNTRILTENDLNNIFAALGVTTATTVSTPYRYRNETAYIASNSTLRFIQTKLDESVSLEDFGVVPNYSSTNITTEFNTAITTIFANGTWDSYQRKDSRRILSIPPGHYVIDQEIKLYPNTVLQGQGPELTRLTLISSTTNLFKTVDAMGNEFESGVMESGLKRSRDISIRGMTLEYDPTKASNNPLLSIDNVYNFNIENCILRTAFVSTTTSTYGLVSTGIGIGIRGQGGGVGSGDANLCENINITDCSFDGLYVGIRGTGTVIRPTITDSVFSNINRGVEFYTLDLFPGPSNGIIKNNRFENIVGESIFVGQNPDLYRTNHISENNFFIQAGNGTGLDDFITTSTSSTPIIRFNSQGNKSINDYFNRRSLANKTTNTNFYYAPLVTGSALVDTVEVMTATAFASTTTNITKIPLTGENQFVSVRYQMFSSTLSRKGDLILNVTPDGSASLTDTYNYIESLEEGTESPEIYFDVNNNLNNVKNYISLTCVNNSTQVSVEYTLNTIV